MNSDRMLKTMSGPYDGQGTCDQGTGSGYIETKPVNPYSRWDHDSLMDYPEEDVVNHPPHYGDGQIECIDYLRDNMDNVMYMGYLEGNVKKYLHRFRYKGKPTEDLKKAQWYLNRLIKEYEGEGV